MRITLSTPLKFLAPGGVAPMGRGAWHLPSGDQPGEWMPFLAGTPVLCERGYHWCEARHAVHWLNAECYLIEPRGETVRGDGKCVSQGARLLRRVETWNDRTACLFAADCAEAVVHLCGDDPRPRAAIAMARRYARGEVTLQELDAARAGATAATAAKADRGAAWAARAAADTARAARAARATWAAARDATWAAAWAETSDAAGAAQTNLLLQYLNGEGA